MENNLGQLSAREFEDLVGRVVDRRLQVWLTQLLDALGTSEDEESSELQPEFAASLRRDLEQSRRDEVIDLTTFRFGLGE